MVGQYEKMLRVLNEMFPEWIDNERCRKVVEGADEHHIDIRLWVRYTGNIVLIGGAMPGRFGHNERGLWRKEESGKLIAIRDDLAMRGYRPDLDIIHPAELELNPHDSKLMYRFPVGTRIVIDKVNKKKKLVREMPLEDRVYIGFSRFDCEGRYDDR
jgi:hypothetical protein